MADEIMNTSSSEEQAKPKRKRSRRTKTSSKATSKVHKIINIRTATIFVTLLLIAAVLFYFRSLFVVAIVNNKPVFRYSVIQELEKQSGKEALDNLITKNLITQEASKQNIQVTKQEIDAEIKNLEDNLKQSGQDLKTILEQQKMTQADLEEQIVLQKKLEKLLGDKVAVTEAEIDAYIEANKDNFAEGTDLNAIRDQIKEQLKQQKFSTEVQKWLADLKAKADIKYIKTY